MCVFTECTVCTLHALGYVCPLWTIHARARNEAGRHGTLSSLCVCVYTNVGMHSTGMLILFAQYSTVRSTWSGWSMANEDRAKQRLANPGRLEQTQSKTRIPPRRARLSSPFLLPFPPRRGCFSGLHFHFYLPPSIF